MSLDHVLGSDLSYRLGWTVVHSLWEGSAAAAVLMPILWLLRHRPPQARYVAATTALGMMLSGAILTFAVLSSPAPAAAPAAAYSEARVFDAPNGARPTELDRSHFTVVPGARSQVSAGPPRDPSDLGNTVPDSHSKSVAWVSGGWALGVLLLSVWCLGGWLAAQRLKVLGVEPAGPALAVAFARVGRQLGVRRPVRALQSALAQTPMVVGWLRPVVLIPLAVLANLTPDQVEAILAHEMAHVRRHDYLLNLFQVLIETLLFYHPAVWWMSRQIRLEREQCCDEIAAEVCGDRRAYAQSLAAVEEARLNGAMAMAAGGSGRGELLNRIHRLLNPGDNAPRRSAGGIAAAAVWTGAALVAIVGLRLPRAPAVTNATANHSNATAPTPAGLGVLLVTKGNYYLETALATICPRLGVSMTTISPADFPAPNNRQVAPNQITIFDRWAPAQVPAGPAIYIGTIPHDAALADRDLEGNPMHVSDADIVKLKGEHPILRGLDLDQVYIADALKLRATEHWESLASSSKGPLILARDDPGRRKIVIGFDATESNWPLKASFPVFLRQSVQWLVNQEPPATKQPADNFEQPKPPPAKTKPPTRPAATFRADCVLSTLAGGKRQVLASPTLNLRDGGEASLLYAGNVPLIVEQQAETEPGIVGKLRVERQPDGGLHLIARLSRRTAAGAKNLTPGQAEIIRLRREQDLVGVERGLAELDDTLASAMREKTRRQAHAAEPYRPREIAEVDQAMKTLLGELWGLEAEYRELLTHYGKNYPTVITIAHELEKLGDNVRQAADAFNTKYLIVQRADGTRSAIPTDLSALSAQLVARKKTLQEAQAALRAVLLEGGIETDQIVKPGEPLAVELEDGTRLEVSVHPVAR